MQHACGDQQQFPQIVHCVARHRGPWYRHSVCDRTWFHGRGHKDEHLSRVGVGCFGCIRIREVQVARPLVSGWNATDLLVVGRAVFDSLGMRPQYQKLPLTTATKKSRQTMSVIGILRPLESKTARHNGGRKD